MLKFPIALAIGLTAGLSAAHADTYIIQGTPSFGPAIVGPVGALPTPHGAPLDILSHPAFHRMAQMCETLGLECGEDRVTAEGGVLPHWTPRHIADAEKRMALLLEDREDYAEAVTDRYEGVTLPPATLLDTPLPETSRVNPHPPVAFGWGRPALPRQFADLFPTRPHVVPQTVLPYTTLPHPVVPHTALPRPYAPQGHSLDGFFQRFNTPGVALHPSFPLRQGVTRPGFSGPAFTGSGFPWHRF